MGTHRTIAFLAIASIFCSLFASSGARPTLEAQDDDVLWAIEEDVAIDSAWNSAPAPEKNAADYDEPLFELPPDIEHYMKEHTQRTQDILEPFSSLHIAPPINATSTADQFNYAQLLRTSSVSREGDYCYSISLLEELGPLPVLMRMPVPQHAPNAVGVCLPSDFPTTNASYGNAEVVVNLNEHVDAGEMESIGMYKISPDGEKIAYTIRLLNGYIAVEYKYLSSKDAGIRLSAQGCNSLAWMSVEHLFYIQRGSNGRCSDVMLYTTGTPPTTATNHFVTFNSTLFLHATKSYTYMEQKRSNSSSLFLYARDSGAGTWKEMYQTALNVQLQPAEIAGGVLVTAFQPILAPHARFVAPSAMHDFLASEKMVLDSSALQNVSLHEDQTLFSVISSDSCLVRWETYGIRNRFVVQRLEGSGNSQQLSTPRYFNINVPTEFQALSSHALSDGGHAVLTYATPLKPVSVYSFNCETNSMVLERQETFPSFDATPYVEAIRYIPTPKDQQAEATFYFKKDKVQLDGQSPMLLAINDGALFFYDPNLRPRLFSLLDQGIIVALVYTRERKELPSSTQGRLVEKQQEAVEDLKAIIKYAVSNSYTSHDRLLLLGALDASASVAALINREPRVCKSAVFLQAAMDSTETLLRSAHVPEADQANSVNKKAAQEFSPILHIPNNPPYFPDVLIVDMQTPNDRGPSTSARYFSRLTKATKDKSLILLYIEFSSPEEAASPKDIFLAFLLKTICSYWNAENGCAVHSSPQRLAQVPLQERF